MSNQKTMGLAYVMYADENDSSMCGGMARYAPTNGIPPWVMPPLDYQGDGSYNQMPLSLSGRQPDETGHELWPGPGLFDVPQLFSVGLSPGNRGARSEEADGLHESG
ncbi:MAG: hypothetical protein ACYS19_19560 [Planctomycetota bacterium]|jgi:hypothetical protein